MALPSGDASPLAGTSALETHWAGTVSGRYYRAEAATDLGAGDWQPVGGIITATNTSVLISDTNTPAAALRFHRLRRQF